MEEGEYLGMIYLPEHGLYQYLCYHRVSCLASSYHNRRTLSDCIRYKYISESVEYLCLGILSKSPTQLPKLMQNQLHNSDIIKHQRIYTEQTPQKCSNYSKKLQLEFPATQKKSLQEILLHASCRTLPSRLINSKIFSGLQKIIKVIKYHDISKLTNICCFMEWVIPIKKFKFIYFQFIAYNRL